jgi:hypothetical protein
MQFALGRKFLRPHTLTIRAFFYQYLIYFLNFYTLKTLGKNTNYQCYKSYDAFRTQLYLETCTWSIILSTTCFGLYIGHHQVYLTLIERLYNLYGVLWGGEEISF